MELNNIITICIPLVVAIVSVALPILSDKISTVGEKYKSTNLLELFDLEFPQTKIYGNVSYFYFLIGFTLFGFIFQIISFKPIECLNNVWVVKNSADLLILFSTILLTIFFIRWVWIFSIYTGNSSKLLKYLISKYFNNEIEATEKTSILNSIHDITLFAIKEGENFLQDDLVSFYSKLFKSYRDSNDKEEVISDSDLYWSIYNIISESVNKNEQKLITLETIATSGEWLFGDAMMKTTISEETYTWSWRYVVMMRNNNRMMKSLWSNSHQVAGYSMEIPISSGEYKDGKYIENNKEERELALNKRKRFIEFFVAVGGLELYNNNYAFLKYMFTYSQSMPPSYYLLLNSINDILYYLERFLNDLDNFNQPVEYRYWFPEFDNLGNSYQVKNEICKYLALLFIRQSTLTDYFSKDERNNFSFYEDDVYKLEFVIGKLPYFKRLISEHLENTELLNRLNLEVESAEVLSLFDEVSNHIEGKLKRIRTIKNLSQAKINTFNKSTKDIIVNAFEQYNVIRNMNINKDFDNTVSTQVSGGTSLMSKSAFVEGDIPNLNFDSSMAETIKSNRINTFIPNAFGIAKTKYYLIEPSQIIKAIDKVIPDIENKMIIGMYVNWQITEDLKASKYKDIYVPLPSTSRFMFGSIIILDKKDLPYIEFADIKPDFEKELSNNGIGINLLNLVKLSEDFNLYAFVCDINNSGYEKIREYYGINIEEGDLQVLVSILFKCIIRWNKERSIVELNMVSEFKEQGIPNDLKDIKPL